MTKYPSRFQSQSNSLKQFKLFEKDYVTSNTLVRSLYTLWYLILLNFADLMFDYRRKIKL